MIQKANAEDYKVTCELAKKSKFIKSFVGLSYRWGWEDNLYVYKEGEKVKGFIQFNLLKRKHQASLYYIYVSLEVRGKGIGRKLFDFFLKSAEHRDLYWKVGIKNIEAVKFYEKFSFKPAEIKDKNYIFLIKER